MLQLTRNVTPQGKRLKEIGIYRRRDDKIQSEFLTDTLSTRIREVLPQKKAPEHETKGELRGILRALHLDNNWLEITQKDGQRIKCDTVHDMLDDVVGPMVNREIIASGPFREYRGVKRLLVEEIELAEDGDT